MTNHDQALVEIARVLARTDLTSAQKCLAVEMLLGADPPAPVPETVAEAARALAWAVWQKTMGRCEYCLTVLNPFDRNARNGFHIDHVVPRAQGGSDDIDNLVPACSRCNLLKHARTPEQWEASRG